jgi:hypothetical protein
MGRRQGNSTSTFSAEGSMTQVRNSDPQADATELMTRASGAWSLARMLVTRSQSKVKSEALTRMGLPQRASNSSSTRLQTASGTGTANSSSGAEARSGGAANELMRSERACATKYCPEVSVIPASRRGTLAVGLPAHRFTSPAARSSSIQPRARKVVTSNRAAAAKPDSRRSSGHLVFARPISPLLAWVTLISLGSSSEPRCRSVITSLCIVARWQPTDV